MTITNRWVDWDKRDDEHDEPGWWTWYVMMKKQPEEEKVPETQSEEERSFNILQHTKRLQDRNWTRPEDATMIELEN